MTTIPYITSSRHYILAPMQVLYGREYQRKALDLLAFGFQPEDSRRCVGAVEKFLANPGHPGLNFERLESGSRQNHWSIRASRDLRVILAVDPASTPPRRVALLNMGHHNAMYDWARRQRHYTDLDVYGAVWAPPGSAGNGDSAVPPNDFEEWMLYLLAVGLEDGPRRSAEAMLVPRRERRASHLNDKESCSNTPTIRSSARSKSRDSEPTNHTGYRE